MQALAENQSLPGSGRPNGVDRTPPQQDLVRYVGAVAIALLVLSFLAWFAGGVGSLAALGLVCTALLLAAIFAAYKRICRNFSELSRFITQLGQVGDAANVGSFDLQYGWAQTARDILKTYQSLIRQLRDRQTALQKLESSQGTVLSAQRRTEGALNCLDDAVLLSNTFGELILANHAAERLFGFKFDSARGKPTRQVIPFSTLNQLIESSIHRMTGAQRHRDELGLELGGKACWFRVTLMNVLDRGVEPVGTAVILHDITGEKTALARSAEFISAVSHEIKTPLASVKAYAEMLADGDTEDNPAEQQKFLSIIEVQTDRMTRLLDSMLDIARIESGEVRIEKKVVSLNEIVERGSKLMASTAADKKLTVQQRLSSLYLPVSVDPDMMIKVVMNLLSNAIKYTEPGGQITLRTQIENSGAIFEVEDTGHGIPAQALPRLFLKFYRTAENGNAPAGSGLGLTLVRHIVEEVHGGKVEVESELNKGSTFRVRIPLEQSN
jgi:PAS domain S-box-containing protein